MKSPLARGRISRQSDSAAVTQTTIAQPVTQTGGQARTTWVDPADVPMEELDNTIPDSPGCDGYPDTVCTTFCCATHDRCYAANGCTAASWCTGQGGAPCDACNGAVAGCIANYGLYGCQIDWPFDGKPAACTTFPCGCNAQECFDARTGATYCAASC